MEIDRRVVATSRLMLAPHVLSDLEDSVRMWSDPAVTQLIRAEPFSDEETWARVLRYVGHWQFMGIGYWTIRRQRDRRFLGEIGFAYTKRRLPLPFLGLPEFSCTLVQDAWGSGVALEAGRAALHWIDTVGTIASTAAITDQKNRSALALAANLGYRRNGLITFDDRPFVVLDRPSGG